MKTQPVDKYAVVIGASGLDVVGRLDAPPLPGTSNPAMIRVSYGGVARNVAENLARLGQAVHLISVVGTDGTGRHLLDHLSGIGIGIEGCILSDANSTGVYMAMLAQDGSRYQALVDRQIMDDMTPTHIRLQSKLIKEAALVFVDGNLPPAVIKTVFHLAHRNHVPICADPTSTSLTKRLKPHLSKIDILTLNAAEAAELSGMDYDLTQIDSNIQAGRKLLELGVTTAIIAMAEYGVCYITHETNGHIPAITTPVIDPTGAGDAFTAAVLYGYLNNLSIDDSIRLGGSAASLTIRTRGSVIPDLSLEMLYDHLII